MPTQFDPDEIMEQLAQENGCSNGSCGYDFDTECYWWLQSKIQGEIEQRDREFQAETHQPKWDPFSDPNYKHVNWQAPNNPNEYLKLLTNFTRMFGGNYGSNSQLFNQLQYGEIKRGKVRQHRFVEAWEEPHIDVEAPSPSDDPFSDGFGRSFLKVPVRDCATLYHGGPADGMTIHCTGPVQSRRNFAYAKPVEWWNASFASMPNMGIARYRLVMIENEPHYFYDPEV